MAVAAWEKISKIKSEGDDAASLSALICSHPPAVLAPDPLHCHSTAHTHSSSSQDSLFNYE